MSSGSRVRRDGTIAMSSKPYAWRAFLPRPISIFHLCILAVGADRRRLRARVRPRTGRGKWARRSAVCELSAGAAMPAERYAAEPWICSIHERCPSAMTRRRSRPAARRPGARATRSGRPQPPDEQPRTVHQALRALHVGQHPHRPRPQLLDRRRLRPLLARARRRGAVRVRLRRLRPAGRARRDRRRRVAQRVGGALCRAHDRPAGATGLLL